MPRGYARDPKLEQAVLDAYMGVDEKNQRKRVFMWEDGPKVMMGNTVAFAQFLGASWATVHQILRENGHTLWNSPKIGRGEIVNEFVAPEAESEVVGYTEPKEPPTVIGEIGLKYRTPHDVYVDLVAAQLRVTAFIVELGATLFPKDGA
jgi:hypothetical protein